MKILFVGGGSGGHITPAVAVLREIMAIDPTCRCEFWTDRKYYRNVVKITTELGVSWGSEAEKSTKNNPYIRVRKISAGKFHRYANWKFKDWFEHFGLALKDLILGNIVGFFGFIGGLIQSFFRLLLPSHRPDVIFLKGGYVCLPVGLVAKRFKIPYIIHESDSVPGLANRTLMKDATIIAMGWNGSVSDSDEGSNKVYTGIPVAAEFHPASDASIKSLKKNFGFDSEKPLVVFTGGSQGSENINQAVAQILPELLKFTSVGLIAGRTHYEDMVDLKKYEEWDKAKLVSDFRMWEFNSAMHELLGAADVIVSRAGATTITELAALQKAVILVPFERLPGGHQVKNAEQLAKSGAAIMIKDAQMLKNPEMLLDEVRHLVRSPRERADLAAKLHEEAVPDAAKRLAKIILEVGAGGHD